MGKSRATARLHRSTQLHMPGNGIQVAPQKCNQFRWQGAMGRWPHARICPISASEIHLQCRRNPQAEPHGSCHKRPLVPSVRRCSQRSSRLIPYCSMGLASARMPASRKRLAPSPPHQKPKFFHCVEKFRSQDSMVLIHSERPHRGRPSPENPGVSEPQRHPQAMKTTVPMGLTLHQPSTKGLRASLIERWLH